MPTVTALLAWPSCREMTFTGCLRPRDPTGARAFITDHSAHLRSWRCENDVPARAVWPVIGAPLWMRIVRLPRLARGEVGDLAWRTGWPQSYGGLTTAGIRS